MNTKLHQLKSFQHNSKASLIQQKSIVAPNFPIEKNGGKPV